MSVFGLSESSGTDECVRRYTWFATFQRVQKPHPVAHFATRVGHPLLIPIFSGGLRPGWGIREPTE